MAQLVLFRFYSLLKSLVTGWVEGSLALCAEPNSSADFVNCWGKFAPNSYEHKTAFPILIRIGRLTSFPTDKNTWLVPSILLERNELASLALKYFWQCPGVLLLKLPWVMKVCQIWLCFWAPFDVNTSDGCTYPRWWMFLIIFQLDFLNATG